jgi:hypothetical protein
LSAEQSKELPDLFLSSITRKLTKIGSSNNGLCFFRSPTRGSKISQRKANFSQE